MLGYEPSEVERQRELLGTPPLDEDQILGVDGLPVDMDEEE